MEILYVTSYPLEYNTSANVRNISIIKGFIRNGHKVYTLSPYPTDRAFYSGKLIDIPIQKRFWIGPQGDISATNKKVTRPNRLKKIIYKWYNTFAVYDRCSRFKKYVDADVVNMTFDVIVSSSDPKSAHLLAEKLIKIKPDICSRWIQYWGDPFIGDITGNTALKYYLTKKEERRIIAKSDKAIYVSPFTAEEVISRYPEVKNKVYFYPIPYIEQSETLSNETLEPMLSYMGNYTLSTRDIRPFVQAVSELKVKTVIIGDSDLRLKANESLSVRERVPSDELNSITDATTIFVCVCNTHGSQIPGKIYHYAGTNKAILIILDGEKASEMKQYFESFNRFYLCRNNVLDIKEAITTILQDNKTFNIPPDMLRPEVISEKFLK